MKKIIFFFIAVAVAAGVTAETSSSQPPARFETLAGWFGVFPEIAGFKVDFEPPVVNGSRSYSQTANYEWMGGRLNRIRATVRHEPASIQRKRVKLWVADSSSTVKQRIDGHTGWLRSRTDVQPTALLTVLDKQTVLLLETRDEVDLMEIASSFNEDLIRSALKERPRLSVTRTVDSFRALTKGSRCSDVANWLGYSDSHVRSDDETVLIYQLPDGSKMNLSFGSNCGDLRSILHEKRGGNTYLMR